MLQALSATRADATGSSAHGRLRASKAGWTVYRRTDLAWRRVRFTEAHEIAHILIYEAIASNRSWLDDLHQAASHELLENLCNFGAAELLVPADDLVAELRAHPLIDIGTYQRLYDRYLVSRTALLRRVCEVTPDTALTSWAWRDHSKGADWRVAFSFTRHLDHVYIPNDLSRRRLDPDVISDALELGAATADGSLDVGSIRLSSTMTAIHPRFRVQAELPMYHGHTVRDEPGEDAVLLLHRGLTAERVRRPRLVRRWAS